MKRILSLIIVSICASLQMSAQDVFFIFRNDGQFNSFFSEDVECIQYSKFDLDGIEHDSYVVQEIVTEDSLYRIPLEVIDSVGFEVPETKMLPDATDLQGKQHDFIISATETSILFRSDCPALYLPSVGDKLGTDEMSDIFPTGFFGKVTNVTKTSEGYVVECERLDMTEIYESYFRPISVELTNDENMVKRRKINTNFDKTITLPTFSKTISFGGSLQVVPDLVSVGVNTGFSTAFDVSINCKGSLLVQWSKQFVDIRTITTITKTTGVSVSGEGSMSNDVSLTPAPIECPIATGVSLFVDAGLFYKLAGVIGIEYSQEDVYRHMGYVTWESGSWSLPNTNESFHQIGHKVNGITVFGSNVADFGAYVKLGVGVTSVAKKFGVNFRTDMGIEVEVKQELYKNDLAKGLHDTFIYDKLNLDRTITVYPFRGSSVNAEFGPVSLSAGITKNIGVPLWTAGLVPKFSDITFKQTKEMGNKLKVSAKLERDVIIPLTLGFKLFDQDKKEVATVYDTKWYSVFNPDYNKMELEIPGLVPGQKYYVHPCIKIFGYDLLASPREEVETDFPVQITNVEVSKASYYPEHYTQNGEKYSFKYNTKTLIELDPDAQVEEWGYFYVDEKNNIAAIMAPSNSEHVYEDSRYAYYRNEPKSQVMFGGLVRYKNDPNYYLNQSPKLYDIEYPKDASISLTSCTFVGTEKDKTYNNKKYNYCTHIKLNFDATGAYWLSVRPLESGDGWKAWDLPSQKMNPVDGANVMNIYYYYDSMPSKGEFKIALRAYDDTHNTSYDSSKYITLSYSNDAFTGCTLQSGNGIKSRIPVTNSSTQSEEDNKPFEFSIIKLTQEKTSLR